jgi:prophage maintenance system killer protein/prophage antirepressor-like protein
MKKISKTKDAQRGKIVIYKTAKNEVDLKVRFEGETVWLRQDEIAKLYGKERSVVTKHIKKIFADKEIDQKSNVQFLHIAKSDKPVAFYSLDVILAIGYRTNSPRAIHFRRWATSVLKNYLTKGYAVNEKRLLEAREKFRELQNVVGLLGEKSKKEMLAGQEGEILSLLASYAKTLTVLEEYDTGNIKKVKGTRATFTLEYTHGAKIVSELKRELKAKKEAGDLFGQERDGSFEGIISGLYQTFDRKELYPSVEDKASHLLYLTIKDHPFSDGNKRSGAFLFVYFLDKCDYLHRKNGEKKISDNALTALALLIAESDPEEKDTMISLTKSLLAD